MELEDQIRKNEEIKLKQKVEDDRVRLQQNRDQLEEEERRNLELYKAEQEEKLKQRAYIIQQEEKKLK